MAAGEYELALPVALDAVQQGQALFKPAPALQLFPLYLLAAQVRRQGHCPTYVRTVRHDRYLRERPPSVRPASQPRSHPPSNQLLHDPTP